EYSGNGGTEGAYQPYATTSYQYDARDLLTLVTDAQQNQTSIAYDALGRKSGMNGPDLGGWQYAYDGAGNLTSQTDTNGQTTSFSYDPLNRPLSERFSVSTNNNNASYTYDQGTNGKGHRTSMTNGQGTTNWSYDARGRVLSTTLTGVPGTTGAWESDATY